MIKSRSFAVPKSVVNYVARLNQLRCNFSTATTPSTTTFPLQVDAIIIGGGVTGCSILYQLAKRGVRTALIERGKLTCGTTFHTAGLIWSLRPSPLEIEVLKGTKRVFKELGEDNCGWINNGSLFVAHCNDEVNEFKQLCEFGRNFGVESYVLGTKESTDLFPMLDSKTFEATLYSPADGVVDPTLLCNALIKASKHLGSIVIENCNVNEILYDQSVTGKRVKGVTTEKGTVKSDYIINARGLWSNQNLNTDTPLPFVAMKHSYIVTDTIQNLNKWPNVRDHDLSIYFRVQGKSLIVGGYEHNPTVVKTVPNDFQFSLYEMDWTTFEPLMKNSIKLCPSLNDIGVKSTICGPEAFSIDRKPLIGPDNSLHGLFHACAFSSNGMMLSGGVAEQVAEWIVNGKPSLNMGIYDLRRFRHLDSTNEEWVEEQCVGNYSNQTKSKIL